MYNVFPAFPTSFIVACNIEIEAVSLPLHFQFRSTHPSICSVHRKYSGDQESFRSVSNSASAHVGWGPFSAHARYVVAHHRYRENHQKLIFSISFSQLSFSVFFTRLPNGDHRYWIQDNLCCTPDHCWVSQILPALPRDPTFQPLLQRNA